MPDERVGVTQPGVAECPRRLEVEEVVAVTVVDDPAVPDPLLGIAQHAITLATHAADRRGVQAATTSPDPPISR
jgi:hypothetical protein